MPINLDSKKTLFVHVHWMKYYDDRPGDIPYKGGAKRDGWMENFNFLDYDGHVFGGFWPGGTGAGDPKDVNVDRLGFRGEANANGITVLFFAPHPDDGHPRLIGWFDDAIVYRRIQTHPDDNQWYNVTTKFKKAHRIPYKERKLAFDFTGWWKQGAHRFGDSATAKIFQAVQREMRRQPIR